MDTSKPFVVDWSARTHFEEAKAPGRKPSPIELFFSRPLGTVKYIAELYNDACAQLDKHGSVSLRTTGEVISSGDQLAEQLIKNHERNITEGYRYLCYCRQPTVATKADVLRLTHVILEHLDTCIAAGRRSWKGFSERELGDAARKAMAEASTRVVFDEKLPPVRAYFYTASDEKHLPAKDLLQTPTVRQGQRYYLFTTLVNRLPENCQESVTVQYLSKKEREALANGTFFPSLAPAAQRTPLATISTPSSAGKRYSRPARAPNGAETPSPPTVDRNQPGPESQKPPVAVLASTPVPTEGRIPVVAASSRRKWRRAHPVASEQEPAATEIQNQTVEVLPEAVPGVAPASSSAPSPAQDEPQPEPTLEVTPVAAFVPAESSDQKAAEPVRKRLGRPPMTPEQKLAAKEKREQAKRALLAAQTEITSPVPGTSPVEEPVPARTAEPEVAVPLAAMESQNSKPLKLKLEKFCEGDWEYQSTPVQELYQMLLGTAARIAEKKDLALQQLTLKRDNVPLIRGIGYITGPKKLEDRARQLDQQNAEMIYEYITTYDGSRPATRTEIFYLTHVFYQHLDAGGTFENYSENEFEKAARRAMGMAKTTELNQEPEAKKLNLDACFRRASDEPPFPEPYEILTLPEIAQSSRFALFNSLCAEIDKPLIEKECSPANVTPAMAETDLNSDIVETVAQNPQPKAQKPARGNTSDGKQTSAPSKFRKHGRLSRQEILERDTPFYSETRQQALFDLIAAEYGLPSGTSPKEVRAVQQAFIKENGQIFPSVSPKAEGDTSRPSANPAIDILVQLELTKRTFMAKLTLSELREYNVKLYAARSAAKLECQ